MIELTEKCYSCRKSNSIPKWGWIWPCYDDVCNYEPNETIEEMRAKTKIAEDVKMFRQVKCNKCGYTDMTVMATVSWYCPNCKKWIRIERK